MGEAPARALPGDARARLAMALALAFGFASVREVAMVPVLGALALGVVWMAGARGLGRRLRGPALLAAAIACALAFAVGPTVLWQAGPLRLRAEGLEAGTLVAGRLMAIVTVTLALLAPLPPLRLAAGLRGLGLPALIADLALLTLRYLEESRDTIARARLARRLRGGRGGWRGLGDHGLILAAALIRANARAERLWAAMRLRGHGADLALPGPPTRADLAAMAAAGLLAAGVVALDRSL